MSIDIDTLKKITSHFAALSLGGIFALSSAGNEEDLGALKLVDTRIITEDSYTAYANLNDCINFSFSVCEAKTLIVYVKK